MNIERFCYIKGKEYLEKEITKLEKKKEKVSQQLFEADPFGNTTQRQRAMLRVRLSVLCQEVDQKKGYLEKVNELLCSDKEV